MCASCVKSIFLRIYKLFGTYCFALFKCTAAHMYWILELKIYALQDVPFTFNIEIVSIILERPWVVAQSDLKRND